MRLTRVIIPALLMALASSCAYRLGDYAPNNIKTLYIGKANRKIAGDKAKEAHGSSVDEPRMALHASQKIRTAFISEGSLDVVENERADAELYMNIDSYTVQSAGSAKLASDDVGQQKYSTTIWRVIVPIRYQLVLKGNQPSPSRWRKVEGQAIFNDLIDITTVRQAAIRQALTNASRKLVRDALDTDWAPKPVKK